MPPIKDYSKRSKLSPLKLLSRILLLVLGAFLVSAGLEIFFGPQ